MNVPPSSSEPLEPRLVTVSRRRFLARSVLAGAIVALPGLACGNSDADAFASTTTAPGASGGGAEGTTTLTTLVGADTASTTAETAATASGPAVPAGSELAVSFTFTAGESSRGPARDPYVAVWLEDSQGNLVDTIALWFEQSGKGSRWLNDLRSWYAASDEAADTTMSGATRSAGSYTVAWDATDLSGQAVAQGDYVLYIEAAREHGPYGVTSTPISLGAEPVTVELADNGEISAATAQLTPGA